MLEGAPPLCLQPSPSPLTSPSPLRPQFTVLTSCWVTLISALLTPCVIARPEPRKKVAQLCPALYDSMACSLPGSSVQGILQARILEWVAFPFSRRTSPPGNQTRVSCIAGRFFTTEPPGKHVLL